MRFAVFLLLLAAEAGAAVAAEEADVLFHAPFENSPQPALARGDAAPHVVGALRYGPGVRGQAVAVDPQAALSYPFAGNCLPDEGTIMMWVRPEWSSDDGQFHHLFRASTGHFGGKSLNAIMLYQYHRLDRLQFYTSNGAQTEPQKGRTLAFREPSPWKAGQWFHVAATWSSTLAATEMYLYVDGRRVSAAGGQVFVPDRIPELFSLGGPKGTAATWLDDVVVFSRPLMAREIEEIARTSREATSAPAELPFRSSPELQIRPFVLSGRDELAVEVDFHGARRELGQRVGRVALALAQGSGERTLHAATNAQGVVRLTAPYAELAPGPCQLRATLTDADGRTLRTGRLDYTIPAKPAWLGNALGKTDEVLAPWTPLRSDERSVGMWGRGYRFDAGPLPFQVESQERRLLRRGIELVLTAGGKRAALEMQAAGARRSSPAEVVQEWSGRLGPLDCRATSRVEFDGLLWVSLELRPDAPLAVDGLRLTVPFAPGTGTLYHHARGDWTEWSDAGAVGPAGWSKAMPFVPYVWMGDERGGLAWFCESDQDWHNAQAERAIELCRTAEGSELRVSFVDGGRKIDAPLRLTFGFMATPVKPMPDGWRDWRPAMVSALNLEGFARRGYRAEGCRNIAVLWNNHVGSFSYLPADPEGMRGKVDLLHRNGYATVLSYFALNYTQTGTPEYLGSEREWRRNPYTENGEGDRAYASVCSASTWDDFLLWAIDRTMDATGTDGVYLDCSNPNYCRSPEHGCAPGRYPLLATRALQKRIYALVKKKRGPAGFVYSHNSENNILTTFAFTDLVLNGEQYNRKPLESLSLEKFRAELSPQPYGVPAILLPTLVKFQPEGREKMPGAEFLAFPLLHDVICSPSWLGRPSAELLRRIEQVMREFGVARAEFLPYWSIATELKSDPAGAVVSGYLSPDGKRLLLVAQSRGAAQAYRLALGGRLASLCRAPARDALSDTALEWIRGELLWPLPKGSVALAIVERR